MNHFLNENWRDIVQEVAPAVADALAQVFRNTIGAMADLVPFEYLFPSDWTEYQSRQIVWIGEENDQN